MLDDRFPHTEDSGLFGSLSTVDCWIRCPFHTTIMDETETQSLWETYRSNDWYLEAVWQRSRLFCLGRRIR
jgi:hypothetical protein